MEKPEIWPPPSEKSWTDGYHKSSSGDEIHECDVTYHLLWLLIYHWSTTHLLRNIFEVTGTYPCGRDLRKAPCVSCYYPLSVFLEQAIILSVDSRLIQEAPLTQRDREHTASWNRIKYCTNGRQIAPEKACNRWMTFKVIQGYCRCCHIW